MTSPIHKREDWELQLSTLWKAVERGRDVSMRVVYETDTRGKAKNQRSYRKPLNGKIIFNQGIILFYHIYFELLCDTLFSGISSENNPY